MRLGQHDADGSRDACAWKAIGFNLDGRITTADDSKNGNDTCHRRSGAASGILADGVGGIDNNFGAHLMATAASLNTAPPDGGPGPRPIDIQVSDALAHGAETLLLRIDDLPDVADDSHAPGALYAVAPLGAEPTSIDAWSVYDDALVDGADMSQPKVTFPDGYVSGGTWVSGAATARITLPSFWGGNVWERIEWPIEAGALTFQLVGGGGVLTGAMPVKALDAAIRPIAMAFGICPGNATYDQVITTLTQPADLVLGVPQLQDPSRECDAISIGVAIGMVPALPPTTVVPRPTPAPTTDCQGFDGDAGGDADTD